MEEEFGGAKVKERVGMPTRKLLEKEERIVGYLDRREVSQSN